MATTHKFNRRAWQYLRQVGHLETFGPRDILNPITGEAKGKNGEAVLVIGRLIESGFVVKTGWGKYQLTPLGTAFLHKPSDPLWVTLPVFIRRA